MSNILEVNSVNSYYGLSHALFDVSLEIKEGEVVSLLGRNGAGKTTTLRSIMGFNIPQTGTVMFCGKDITKIQVYKRSQQGIGFVPEDRRIFPELTVEENLIVAEKSGKAAETDGKGKWSIEQVYEMFPKLQELRLRFGKNLSGGEQQMLTIARALMGNPKLLLLDEVSEGLAPSIVKMLKEHLLELKKTGMSMLLCEQNLMFVSELSDRAYIVENGEIRYEGTMDHLEHNRSEWEQYLSV
ncbi:ABC transporter ATP-binding protein [Paradesulfitobacterium aromaticivorans]